jgi:RNase adaptor protein for sRNA GlmZ degradation
VKIALVGHSGSGKTTYAGRINKDRMVGDMDRMGLIGVPTADEIIAKILDTSAQCVAVSVHIKDKGRGLVEVLRLKAQGEDRRFAGIRFVYVSAREEVLHARLTAPGEARTTGNIASTMADFYEADVLFRSLADVEIPTSDLSVDQVVSRILRLVPLTGDMRVDSL